MPSLGLHIRSVASWYPKKFVHLATDIFLRHSRTRFKNISSCLARISTPATLCNGGLVAVHSSLTSHVLQGICSRFLVSLQLF
jgi:hypothetical protein